MSSGVQCFDVNGAVRFQASDYLARSLGVIQVVGANGAGSVTDSRLAGGVGWAIFFPTGRGSKSVRCLVSVNSSSVSWSFGGVYANTGYNPDGFIVYGIK